MPRSLLAAPLLLALAACGFTPLYATGEGIRSEMRGVAVGAVTGPPDAAYYAEDALRDVLPSSAAEARHELQVALRDQRRAVAVTARADTTRFDYVLVARYRLRDVESGEVRENQVSTTVSYGVVASQYASLVGREDAVRRAAVDLARRVETDVALYLRGRAPASSTVPLPDVLERDDEEALEDFDDDVFGDPDDELGVGEAPEDEATDAPAPTRP